MKFLTSIPVLVLTAIVSLQFGVASAISVGHPDHAQPEHPDHPSKPDHPEHPSKPDHPEHPTKPDHPEHPSSDSATEQAKAIFEKLHSAYKGAEAISEVIKMKMPAFMGGEAETMEMRTLCGADQGSMYIEEMMTVAWVDGKVFVAIEEEDDKYAVTEAKSFYDGIKSLGGDEGGIPGIWTLALRDKKDMDAWVSSFSMGMPDAKVSKVTSTTNDQNENVEVISIATMMARIDITVNGNKIENVSMIFENPGMEPMIISADSEVTFLKEGPQVSFDVAGREKFDSVDELMGMGDMTDDMDEPEEPDMAGKTAPDFTLSQLDGSGDITLSSLKGQVVVLDFWATWCGPCKLGLPYLNEFDAWVQEEGLNAKVFAVNVWERGDTDAVHKVVSAFWKDKKFKTAVLMGSSNEKLTSLYKINGIPTTVIIGMDGSIVDQHSGFGGGEAMVKGLKEKVLAALAE
jgi:cytochrome c biogenesis protein CcmG/thiol:disulfide interchange protein DsbE